MGTEGEGWGTEGEGWGTEGEGWGGAPKSPYDGEAKSREKEVAFLSFFARAHLNISYVFVPYN